MGKFRVAAELLQGGHGDYPMEVSGKPYRETSDSVRLCRDPKVSIVVTIYNHAPYLRDAIEGLVAQSCSFEYEILLCEDASSDQSYAVCRAYQKRYPGRIRVLHAIRNLGGRLNSFCGVAAARGRYIALLEGDDYWTHPLKLAHQVALMESTGLPFCVAWNSVRKGDAGAITPIQFPDTDRYLDVTACHRYYHTSTFCFEKALWQELRPFFRTIPYCDTTLFYLAIQQRGCCVLREYVSVYRQTGQGIYTGGGLRKAAMASVTMFARMVRSPDIANHCYIRRSYLRAVGNLIIADIRERSSSKLTLAALLVLLGNACLGRFPQCPFVVLHGLVGALRYRLTGERG